MTPLVVTPPIESNDVPLDISADGSVVVGTYNNASAYNAGLPGGSDFAGAYIWTETDGGIAFQQYLLDEFGLNLPGWTLQAATGISANGTVVTGYGMNPDGNREAWVVDLAAVPEPASLSLMLLASLSGLTFRNRKGDS